MRLYFISFFLLTLTVSAQTIQYPEEKHLKNVRQLTFGGDNAEAYWSFDGKMVSFQSNNKAWGLSCDQVFYLNVDGQDLSKGQKPQLISTAKGRTTCSFFMPGNKSILYASTHLGGDACPPDPERKPGGKYLWPIYDTYDIFISDLSGTIKKQLTNTRSAPACRWPSCWARTAIRSAATTHPAASCTRRSTS